MNFAVEQMRLQKFLARAGVASRRSCEEIIASGRVSINGEVVREMGTKVTPGVDVVTLDGVEIRPQSNTVVLMLNKPAGVLSAMSDSHGGACVSELIPTSEFPGLFPVGRLDKDTTGLLLFTNNGELGNALVHPRHHVGKTYLAWVSGSVGEAALKSLREGIELEDGPTQPAKVRILERLTEPGSQKTLLEITIYEGRNRQIRRMGAAVNHPVERLERIGLGPLTLDSLPCGQWRLLNPEEERALLDAAGLSSGRME